VVVGLVVARSLHFTPYMVANGNTSEGNYKVLGHMVKWCVVIKLLLFGFCDVVQRGEVVIHAFFLLLFCFMGI
jgi:hypothetical protein